MKLLTDPIADRRLRAGASLVEVQSSGIIFPSESAESLQASRTRCVLRAMTGQSSFRVPEWTWLAKSRNSRLSWLEG